MDKNFLFLQKITWIYAIGNIIITMATYTYAKEMNATSFTHKVDLIQDEYEIQVYCINNVGIGGTQSSNLTIDTTKPDSVSCETYIPGNICKEQNRNVSRRIGIQNITGMEISNTIYCNTLQSIWRGQYSIWNVNETSNIFVRSLDLSGVGLTYLPISIFKPFTSLQYLNIANNFISEYDHDFHLIIPNIIVLNLSSNILTEFNWTIANPFFEPLELSDNRISRISISERINQSIIIDISHNKLTCIDMPLQNLLKSNITVYLGGNPFTCECMNSLQNGKYDKCICDTNSKLDNKGCFIQDTFFIKTLVLLGIISIVCSIIYIIYMFRNKSNLCRCVKYQHDLIELVVEPTDSETFEKQAYIVCDERDSRILGKILYELEEKRQMNLVCDIRDAPPNGLLISFIEKCLSSSRRTIFVLSSNFLNNKLCLYVLKLAASLEFLEQRCVIIIIKVTGLTKEQTELQKTLTFGKITFEYTSIDENNESFWNALSAAINDRNLQFQILGIQQDARYVNTSE